MHIHVVLRLMAHFKYTSFLKNTIAQRPNSNGNLQLTHRPSHLFCTHLTYIGFFCPCENSSNNSFVLFLLHVALPVYKGTALENGVDLHCITVAIEGEGEEEIETGCQISSVIAERLHTCNEREKKNCIIEK